MYAQLDARQQAFWGQTAIGSLYRLATAPDPLFPWLIQEFGGPGVMGNAQLPLLCVHKYSHKYSRVDLRWHVVFKINLFWLFFKCILITIPFDI